MVLTSYPQRIRAKDKGRSIPTTAKLFALQETTVNYFQRRSMHQPDLTMDYMLNRTECKCKVEDMKFSAELHKDKEEVSSYHF